jgi:1-acyl-sn-glycerol-3-phosphate acyltransferase
MDNWGVLSRFEKVATGLMRWANQSPATYVWQRYVLIPFFGNFFDRRLVIRGIERVPTDKDARILLVSNHRTFFDQFALGFILWRHRGLSQRLSFPVRATFFYENPLGLALCLTFSGGTMHPPFFRETSKKGENKAMLQELIARLKQPGQLVGFHPEGKRNKSDDPYTLLPAQPGVGELALKARPLVVPAFITGLTNSAVNEIKSREPIVAVFGDPIELPQFEGELRLSHYKRTADLFNEKIAALGAEEKAALSEASRKPARARR